MNTYINIYLFMDVDIYMYMCIDLYMSICIYIYTHTHTHVNAAERISDSSLFVFLSRVSWIATGSAATCS